MARLTRLPETIYDYNFVQLARQEPHACTRERLLGMAHLQKHGSLTRTAQALFVHITTVQNWLNRFRREGLAGLQEKPRPGRANKLTGDQLARLPELIDELTAEKPGGRVKGKDIQARLAAQFGVHSTCSCIDRAGRGSPYVPNTPRVILLLKQALKKLCHPSQSMATGRGNG